MENNTNILKKDKRPCEDHIILEEVFGDDDFFSYEFLTDDNDPMEIEELEGNKEITFPEGKIDILIEAVRQRPALWNIKNEEYRNRIVRLKLRAEVLLEINLDEKFRGVAMERWDTLKIGYSRTKKPAPSASGGKNAKYKYSQVLSFLDDTNEPRRTTTLMSPATPNRFDEEIAPRSKRAAKLTSHQKFQAEALEILKDLNQPKQPQKPDHSLDDDDDHDNNHNGFRFRLRFMRSSSPPNTTRRTTE